MFGDVMKNAENMHKFAKFASHPQAFLSLLDGCAVNNAFRFVVLYCIVVYFLLFLLFLSLGDEMKLLIISRYDKEHYRHGGHLKRHAASEAILSPDHKYLNMNSKHQQINYVYLRNKGKNLIHAYACLIIFLG